MILGPTISKGLTICKNAIHLTKTFTIHPFSLGADDDFTLPSPTKAFSLSLYRESGIQLPQFGCQKAYFIRLSSQVFTVGSRGGCNNIAGLVKDQKSLCRQYPTLMETVGYGARLGLRECQHQFSTSRWNCSHMDQRRKGLLGLLTSKGNREAAFFQAITSAGVVMEITTACNKDKHHQSCTCDHKYRGKKTKDFEWNGCNDNINFGIKFAQKFLDAREIGNDARVLMNKQNNLAGRMSVKRQMKLECTCHGVSGACNVKTCRHTLPFILNVGNVLQQRYHEAVFVTLDQSSNVLSPKHAGVEKHTEDDLVYLEESPDYCVKNVKEGTLGVAGRRCNKTSSGPDGCDVMCCGMGFHAKRVWVEANCKCKFIWCCKVKCEKCRTEEMHYFCRGKKRRRKKSRLRQHDSPLRNYRNVSNRRYLTDRSTFSKTFYKKSKLF